MMIAVDTGGTKTLVTSFDNDGQPNAEFRFPTPTDQNEYLETLKKVLNERYLANGVDIEAVVIAIPGIVEDNRLVTYKTWVNLDVAGALASSIQCPIWLLNDAKLGGIGEANLLSPVPDSCLYVTISTGIGTGIILNGRVPAGLDHSEGGHIRVQYEGKEYVWEELASGKAIHETYNSYARDIIDPSVWQEIARKISTGFKELIPILQPDVIIIGGSIGTYFERYGEYLRGELAGFFADQTLIALPEIRQATHPEEAVVYGCYAYAQQQLTS